MALKEWSTTTKQKPTHVHQNCVVPRAFPYLLSHTRVWVSFVSVPGNVQRLGSLDTVRMNVAPLEWLGSTLACGEGG